MFKCNTSYEYSISDNNTIFQIKFNNKIYQKNNTISSVELSNFNITTENGSAIIDIVPSLFSNKNNYNQIFNFGIICSGIPNGSEKSSLILII